MSPDHATPGNGLLLFFRVDDFGMALARARTLGSKRSPTLTQILELGVLTKDADGYYVTINAISAA